jgi:hypothetical protein
VHIRASAENYCIAATEDEELRGCFSGSTIDCFFLATGTCVLPGFWASAKNSSAFHEKSLVLVRAWRSATLAF